MHNINETSIIMSFKELNKHALKKEDKQDYNKKFMNLIDKKVGEIYMYTVYKYIYIYLVIVTYDVYIMMIYTYILYISISSMYLYIIFILSYIIFNTILMY